MEGDNKINWNKDFLYQRVKDFIVKVIKFIDKLPKTSAGFKIGGQIVDSSGSIGANYSEAQAARSRKEFIAIFGTVLKETKETTFWLDLIKDSGLITQDENLLYLIAESKQLEKIFAQIIISSSKKL